MLTCKTCGKEIREDWRKDKQTRRTTPLLYCSRSCSNTRDWSTEKSSIKEVLCSSCSSPITVNKRTNADKITCLACKQKKKEQKSKQKDDSFKQEAQERKLKAIEQLKDDLGLVGEDREKPLFWEIESLQSQGKYLFALIPNHPNSYHNGRYLYHRAVMECSLNRILLKEEVVHHKNGDRTNNSRDNLEVLTPSEHARQHQIGKKVMAKIKCPSCQKIIDREYRLVKRNVKKGQLCFCSKICIGDFKFHCKSEEEKTKAFEENVIEVCNNNDGTT